MNATKPELTALIDWVQVTFKNANALEIIEKVLMLNRGYMTHENRGRFRYAGRWTFGGIEVLTAPADYPERGTHLYMTGSACRVFEIYLKAQDRTWFDFLNACLQYEGNFTRLDWRSMIEDRILR